MAAVRNSVRDDRIEYRGFSILIDVDESPGAVVGRADLFKRNDFRGRLAVGSADRSPEAVRHKLRCLAKSKVDRWASAGMA